jgi:hypothetical protein
MTIQYKTEKGGCVELIHAHGVWISYAVSKPELLYCGITLPNDRQVQFFVNRETGLMVVEVIAPDRRGGNEILRMDANAVGLPVKTT